MYDAIRSFEWSWTCLSRGRPPAPILELGLRYSSILERTAPGVAVLVDSNTRADIERTGYKVSVILFLTRHAREPKYGENNEHLTVGPG